MTLRFSFWLFNFVIHILACAAFAQNEKYPVRQWISELSVKKKNPSDNSTIQSIVKLGPTEYCDAVDQLYKQSRSSNTRSQIRANHIYEQLTRAGTCPGA